MDVKQCRRSWALLWHSRNALDGLTEHFVIGRDGFPRNGIPALFKTRAEARQYAEKSFGHIKTRPDLRAEPHGWRMPRAVRVMVKVETA